MLNDIKQLCVFQNSRFDYVYFLFDCMFIIVTFKTRIRWDWCFCAKTFSPGGSSVIDVRNTYCM